MVYEAQLLFGSILTLSGYLVFRVLEAGLLGSISARYFEWAGRAEERRKLELALVAEKPTLHLKWPSMDPEPKQKFDDLIAKVPIDEATGEAILEGSVYKKWLEETKLALVERNTETINAYRQFNTYFLETYVKSTYGLASARSFKEADAMRISYDNEFNDIVEWAKRLKSGWEQQIMGQSSQMADNRMRRKMDEMRMSEQNAQTDIQNRQKEKIHAKIAASEKFFHQSKSVDDSNKQAEGEPTSAELDMAREIEEELIAEESKKKASKKSAKKSAA